MKKVLVFLVVAMLYVFVCGCGKSESVIAAEEAVKAIGNVTLESEEAIAAAEEIVSSLSEEDAKTFSMQEELTKARDTYTALVEQEKINEVIALVDAIGAVTLDSGEKVDAAQEAYDDLSEENKQGVSNYSTLQQAETELDALRAEEKQKVLNEKLSLFDIEEDRVEGVTWYQPKNMPTYINTRSYIIPYIGVRGDQVWLCIQYNYTDDDWVFWEKLTIMTDEKKYYQSVSYGDTVRDNAHGDVWEYYDDSDVTENEMQMLADIAAGRGITVGKTRKKVQACPFRI